MHEYLTKIAKGAADARFHSRPCHQGGLACRAESLWSTWSTPCSTSRESDTIRYRILRAVKNRFGSTDEIGIFEMREEGLVEVPTLPKRFWKSVPSAEPGRWSRAPWKGSRPILVEIQALVAPSYFTSPRRTCTGVDYNKMLMILAVLEKRVGLALGNKDVYVNVAGGVKIVEPAADMAIALAIASSLLDCGVDASTIAIGEIGLAGEIRDCQPDRKENQGKQRGWASKAR